MPSPRLVGGTKGSHLITRNPALSKSLSGSGVYAAAADGRPVFLLPFGDSALVGTTELPFDAGPETAVASEDELTYLLDLVNRAFPHVSLTRDDVGLWRLPSL